MAVGDLYSVELQDSDAPLLLSINDQRKLDFKYISLMMVMRSTAHDSEQIFVWQTTMDFWAFAYFLPTWHFLDLEVLSQH